MGSLKSFIKSVRKAKTIADERAVIRKESASIRTSFRDSNLDQNSRRVNISKLLYLYIMGEKTHFGQVECIKLLASPRFVDKRLGYLATMLLLDENQEVLTLLTNSLDNDMQHPNTFIVGLALCCLGNIASPELARDLYANVEKIIGSNNLYLRKKACIVAAKLIQKEPDLAEVFSSKATQLLDEKAAGPLLGTLRLIQSLYYNSPEYRSNLVKLIPKIVSHLRRVATSGYMPEYDVMGSNDPFLQVSLLSTLRVLAMDENCTSSHLEEINDILTQVASNIDSGKNAAHAILYECVKTIFAINSDQSLKILGVNSLGKFLSTKDNNTRYVALDSLLKVIYIEPLAVQRHRATIVSCLSDSDISIRRRALELTFAILNEQNIRVLVREILVFLEKCNDDELKPYITSQLTIAANKFSPNQKWHFDTLIRMLKLSGNFVPNDILSNILALILQCNDAELKYHVVSRLLLAILEDSSQYGLSLITVWSLGEYADMILGKEIEVGETKKIVDERTIIDLINGLINNSTFNEQETVQLITYILTAVIKLSVKFTSSTSLEQLRQILNSKANDNNLEIQIRAIEYQEIFFQDATLRKGLLAKMPAPPVKHREALSLSNRNNDPNKSQKSANLMSSTTNDLLDLMDDVNNGSNSAPTTYENSDDLLADIFGSGSSKQTNNKSKQEATNSNADILNLFESPNPKINNTPTPSDQAINVFNNSNIKLDFIKKDFHPGQAIFEALISLNSSNVIHNVQLLIAVPKSQKVTMSSTSGGDTLANGSFINQMVKITGKEGSKIKLRIKLRYNLDDIQKEEMVDFSGFGQTI